MIRVVSADDSPFLRKVLREVLEASGKIEVVGEAMNGKEAIEQVKSLKPDILILDCEMPVMNGLEALRHIMDECPLPVFIFSSLASEGAAVTLKALEYGAVDFLLKPTGGAHQLGEVAPQLIEKIEYIARRNRWRLAGARPVASGQGPEKKPLSEVTRRAVDLVAVGSSTGGVQAAVEVIKRLPAKTRPIVWVQHMPASFTGSFAARLNALGTVRVFEAKNGQTLQDNTCYIAPGGFQMRVRKNGSGAVLNIGGVEKVNGFCPSCDVLFDSVAQYYANNAVGVILTGMGDDGSRGLLKMHQRGSIVIGQNEETCTVYGMPRAAFVAGAVDMQVDIADVSEMIVRAGGGER
ncbi:MAG: chemotaxis response regulator protein-glutamate methylesterase [Candidatus Omnitrophica bacterium]|nr:chemotaxis response regulator protein-glutamate methylesterase [Candidatus Omnitrophota bacterium]